MKKSIFSLGMMLVATLSLTNCSKEVDAPTSESETVIEGVPFEIFANSAETKTAITGLATRWVSDDKINVFHAVAGNSSYYDDGQFTVDGTDLTVGRFTGTLDSENLPVTGKYDWYAIYPYSSYIKSPENTGDNPGRVYIGKKSNEAQVQTGNSTTNHLSGSNFPLYGVATNVDFNASPSITLNNIVSVVEIKVTNKNDAPLVVNSVSFTAPEGTTIVGQYEINYAANPMTFTDYSTNTSSVANLTVNNGAAIAKDAYASFYIGIKPFTATTGQVLKLSVNGYEKSVTLPSNVTFASGKIKTLNFNFDQDPQASTTFVFNTSAGLAELGISEPAKSNGTNLTGPYTKNNVSISFTQSTGGTAPRVWKDSKSVLDLRLYTGNTISFHAPTGYNIVKIEFSSSSSYTADSGTYNGNTWTGSASEIVLTKSSSNHNVNTILVTCSQQQIVPTIANTSVSNADAHGGANLTKDIVLSHYDAAPSLTATPDGTIVTAASVDNVTTSGATVTYTLAPNYSGAAAVGTITVSDGAGHEGTVTVNQVADVFTVSRTSIELYANSGAYATMTVNSDYDWTIDDSSLNGFTVSPNSFTYAGNRSQTVTITATGNNATASPVDLDIFCITRTADSKSSDVITVSQKSAKLATPTLTITPDSENKKFTVSWPAVTNASKYEYSVLDGNADYKVNITQTADASTLSFEVTAINYDEEYTVSVKAIGNGSPWISSEEAVESVSVAAGDQLVTFKLKDYFSSATTLTDGNTYSFGAFDFQFEKHNSSVSNYNASDKGFRFYKDDVWIISAGSKKMKSISFKLTNTNNVGPFSASDGGTCSSNAGIHTWTAKNTDGVSTVTLTATAQIRYTEFTITYAD